jgi:hypothetical protein
MYPRRHTSAGHLRSSFAPNVPTSNFRSNTATFPKSPVGTEYPKFVTFPKASSPDHRKSVHLSSATPDQRKSGLFLHEASPEAGRAHSQSQQDRSQSRSKFNSKDPSRPIPISPLPALSLDASLAVPLHDREEYSFTSVSPGGLPALELMFQTESNTSKPNATIHLDEAPVKSDRRVGRPVSSRANDASTPVRSNARPAVPRRRPQNLTVSKRRSYSPVSERFRTMFPDLPTTKLTPAVMMLDIALSIIDFMMDLALLSYFWRPDSPESCTATSKFVNCVGPTVFSLTAVFSLGSRLLMGLILAWTLSNRFRNDRSMVQWYRSTPGAELSVPVALILGMCDVSLMRILRSGGTKYPSFSAPKVLDDFWYSINRWGLVQVFCKDFGLLCIQAYVFARIEGGLPALTTAEDTGKTVTQIINVLAMVISSVVILFRFFSYSLVYVTRLNGDLESWEEEMDHVERIKFRREKRLSRIDDS